MACPTSSGILMPDPSPVDAEKWAILRLDSELRG